MFSAIIQARVGSTRLPNKVFADLSGKPLIWHVCNRLKFSKKINEIIIATTTSSRDDAIEEWCNDNNYLVFRGSENNVLNRFYEAAKHFKVGNIVRITADDPFKDPSIIDNVISMFINEKLDFAFNNNPPTFPEGLDTEVFSFKAIEKANHLAKDSFDKEHVTQYFYKNTDIFKTNNFINTENLSYLRWTIDTIEDLEMAKEVYKELYKVDKIFLMQSILELLKAKPHIEKMNLNIKRSTLYNNNLS